MRPHIAAAFLASTIFSTSVIAQENVDPLVERWNRANKLCSVKPQTARTKPACDERSAATRDLLTNNYCNTPLPGAGPEKSWYRCEESTLPYPPSDEAGVEDDVEPVRPAVTPQSAGLPYDLRGIRLGASLDSVRAMRHPDGEPARLFCSGDPDVEKNSLSFPDLTAHVVDRTTPAGTRFCQYYRARSERDGVIDTGFKVATVGSFVTFDFVPGKGGQPLLYRITVRTNVSGWPLLWEGYTSKYGKPARVSNAPAGNRVGGVFDNVTGTWENGASRITLIKRHQRIDNTFVFYEHKALSASVEQRLRARTGTPASGL